MSSLSNDPHDKLFKEIFSKDKEAAVFLKESLPVHISEKINWKTLKVEKSSFIDSELKGSESDLLYNVKLDKTGKTSYIYVLFEHQSSPDKWMGFRLLKYMCRIWDKQFDEHPRSKYLRPILPIVLYQGKKKWNISTKFTEQFGEFDLDRSFFPEFKYYLIDQTDLDTKNLNGLIASKILQLLLYSSTLGNLDKVGDDILSFLSKLPDKPGLEIKIIFYQYLIYTQPKKVIESFTKKLKEYKISEDNMVTYAETLVQEGMQKGRQEGRQEGELQNAREDVLDVFNIRFKEVPYLIEKKVNACNNLIELKRIFKASILANSLDEIDF